MKLCGAGFYTDRPGAEQRGHPSSLEEGMSLCARSKECPEPAETVPPNPKSGTTTQSQASCFRIPYYPLQEINEPHSPHASILCSGPKPRHLAIHTAHFARVGPAGIVEWCKEADKTHICERWEAKTHARSGSDDVTDSTYCNPFTKLRILSWNVVCQKSRQYRFWSTSR